MATSLPQQGKQSHPDPIMEKDSFKRQLQMGKDK